MIIKKIVTHMRIPLNVSPSEQMCENMLKQMSNDLSKPILGKLIKGGKTMHKKRRSTKHKKTRRKYTIKGGTKFGLFYILLILFFIFNPIAIDSLSMWSDSEVLSRILEAGKHLLVYDNPKGTCASNALFFMKSVSFETHVHNLINSVKMDHGDISNTLYANATLETKWIQFDMFDIIDPIVPNTPDDKNIYDTFDNLSKTSEGHITLAKMYIQQLKQYCSNIGRGFVTLFSYPVGKVKINHAVILWYTQTGNIIIIDPQLFERYGVEIYSDINDDFEKYDAGRGIKVRSLTKYIADSVKLNSVFDKSMILESKHFTLNDVETELSSVNPFYEKGMHMLSNKDL